MPLFLAPLEITENNGTPANSYTLDAGYSVVIVRIFTITTTPIVLLSLGSRLRIL